MPAIPDKLRSPRNRSLRLTDADRARLRSRLSAHNAAIGTMQGNCLDLIQHLPSAFVDLLILDPPYNLTKDFDGLKFAKRAVEDYTAWLDHLLIALKPLLKPTASLYICGDWLSSTSIFTVAARHFIVRNRITWEREKGRGAKANWKNASEDIWFCTVSNHYTFNIETVKLRRQVKAPYRTQDGTPKDWEKTGSGNFRDTHPSNCWTDITIPFWSMAENTDHPTQKSEKLIAKLILASSNVDDLVFDPFVGSGTSSVVAKKLGRSYLGIDVNEEYCLLTERRLELADSDPTIQGFTDGVFWERNTLAMQKRDPDKEETPE
ncbi:DNA-methyltransferase [Myxacorys almedinensis]|uniref:Methyltransferase n=1 Tax=Myxacorys almedinensis A TaxID=2690445 RepID=A0A8J7Z7A9_9CYAN|nr:DNA methyltransferase [Myxacorys almedinensis]NDJ16830.1 site-specific DNA-methyltransferase [Myxacorys almedinensis A]